MLILACLLSLADPIAPTPVLNIPPPAAREPIAFKPDDIAWKPGPASLPPGTKSALLEGDPTKPGIVTMRLWVPKGFRLAQHTHPADERVTVLSGQLDVTYEGQPKARAFPAGSFYVTPKGMKHSVAADVDSVIQITVEGPWGVEYIDKANDPRTRR